MIDGAEATRVEARWGSDPSEAHSEAYKSGGLSEAYESGGVGERSEGLGSAAWGGVRDQAGCCWGVGRGSRRNAMWIIASGCAGLLAVGALAWALRRALEAPSRT